MRFPKSDPDFAAAAIAVAWGRWVYPRGGIARTLAGSAYDLAKAARLRAAGDLRGARNVLDFARDARRFAPASPLP